MLHSPDLIRPSCSLLQGEAAPSLPRALMAFLNVCPCLGLGRDTSTARPLRCPRPMQEGRAAPPLLPRAPHPRGCCRLGAGVGSALGARSSTDGHGAAAATVPGTQCSSGHLPAMIAGTRRSDGCPERWCVISEVFEIRDLPRLPCHAASWGPSAAQRASSQPGTPG